MSTPSKLFSVSSSTGICRPWNSMKRPAERAEARSFRSDNGNLRCARHWIRSTPTAPVAPTIATMGRAEAGCCMDMKDSCWWIRTFEVRQPRRSLDTMRPRRCRRGLVDSAEGRNDELSGIPRNPDGLADGFQQFGRGEHGTTLAYRGSEVKPGRGKLLPDRREIRRAHV